VALSASKYNSDRECGIALYPIVIQLLDHDFNCVLLNPFTIESRSAICTCILFRNPSAVVSRKTLSEAFPLATGRRNGKEYELRIMDDKKLTINKPSESRSVELGKETELFADHLRLARISFCHSCSAIMSICLSS
jgi:hypothetical protein